MNPRFNGKYLFSAAVFPDNSSTCTLNWIAGFVLPVNKPLNYIWKWINYHGLWLLLLRTRLKNLNTGLISVTSKNRSQSQRLQISFSIYKHLQNWTAEASGFREALMSTEEPEFQFSSHPSLERLRTSYYNICCQLFTTWRSFENLICRLFEWI